VEIFARKYYPSLDGTERHTALAEGKAICLSLLPHGECGSGQGPELKFRVGRPPALFKGQRGPVVQMRLLMDFSQKNI